MGNIAVLRLRFFAVQQLNAQPENVLFSGFWPLKNRFFAEKLLLILLHTYYTQQTRRALKIKDSGLNGVQEAGSSNLLTQTKEKPRMLENKGSGLFLCPLE